MPRETGTVSCSLPLPEARPRTLSAWPWYEPRNVTILSRPVAARARRMAAELASVPELAKATRSRPVSSASSSAASPVSMVRGPSWMPRERCSRTASVTKSGSWPKRRTPKPIVMSTYWLPSTSWSRAPLARRPAIGYSISFVPLRKPTTARLSARTRR